MKNNICVIGDVGVDRYVDLKIEKPGGCALNFSCHYKTVSPTAHVSLLCVLGTQSNNRSIFDCIEAFNIEEHIYFLFGETPVQPIRLHVNGEKIFFDYQPSVLKNFRLNDAQLKTFKENRHIMTIVSPDTENLFNQILSEKTFHTIAADFMNLSDYSMNLKNIFSLLERTDVCFFGLNHSNRTIISELKTLSEQLNKLFIITLGDKGAIAFDRGNENVCAVDKPVKMVDSTGAGDSFSAAFLAKYYDGYPLTDALKFANSYASNTVTHLGAIPLKLKM